MVDQAIRDFGTIDVLVNNAGIIAVSPVEHVTMDDYHNAMNNLFWGAVHAL